MNEKKKKQPLLDIKRCSLNVNDLFHEIKKN